MQPIIVFIAGLSGRQIPLPAFDMTALMSETMGLLRFVGLRTFEKLKDISKGYVKFPVNDLVLIPELRTFTFQ